MHGGQAVDGGHACVGVPAVAEDGDAAGLGDWLAANSGLTSPIAPGVYAVHASTSASLFTEGSADNGAGLEGLAEGVWRQGGAGARDQSIPRQQQARCERPLSITFLELHVQYSNTCSVCIDISFWSCEVKVSLFCS